MDLQQAIFRDCFHSWKRWITCGVLWWGGGVLQFCWKRTMKGAWCRYPVPKARWFFYETEAWSSKSNCSEKHALPIASVYGIYIYIYQHLLHSYIYIYMGNVGKYTIHGCYPWFQNFQNLLQPNARSQTHIVPRDWTIYLHLPLKK